MRKLLLASLFFMAAPNLFAQVKTAFFGGPQISTAKYRVNSIKQATGNKYGFQLGAAVKVPFENNLYFVPSVFYSLKGYEVTLNQMSVPPDSLAIDNDTRIHTLELAALVQYDFNKTPNHFFVKFGPSIDVQLFGKEKFNRSNHTVIEQDMVFSFTKYGRFAANLLVHFGYETKSGLLVFAHYGHGIGDMNNADFGPAIWHRVYGVSFGKYFGRKK